MKECCNAATQALVLNVPAKGYPIKEYDPIRVVIGLPLCERHITEAKPSEFFTADKRLEQVIRTMARGRAEPDFARAFTSGVSFDSEEWRALTKGKAQ